MQELKQLLIPLNITFYIQDAHFYNIYFVMTYYYLVNYYLDTKYLIKDEEPLFYINNNFALLS